MIPQEWIHVASQRIMLHFRHPLLDDILLVVEEEIGRLPFSPGQSMESTSKAQQQLH